MTAVHPIAAGIEHDKSHGPRKAQLNVSIWNETLWRTTLFLAGKSSRFQR